jgi:hypothetical protein
MHQSPSLAYEQAPPQDAESCAKGAGKDLPGYLPDADDEHAVVADLPDLSMVPSGGRIHSLLPGATRPASSGASRLPA